MLCCVGNQELLNTQTEGMSNQPASWWRHQMETFSALLALSAGNSPVTGEFPQQRPVARSFDVFVDLRLNKQLIEQSWAGDLRLRRSFMTSLLWFPLCRGPSLHGLRYLTVCHDTHGNDAKSTFEMSTRIKNIPFMLWISWRKLNAL